MIPLDKTRSELCSPGEYILVDIHVTLLSTQVQLRIVPEINCSGESDLATQFEFIDDLQK